MGFFDLFRRDKKDSNPIAESSLKGPFFLEGFTISPSSTRSLKKNEWRKQLTTPAGNTRFKIKYYGQRHEKYTHLIVATDFAPSLVVAVDTATEQEILLFDGCRHGYNAMFCDTYTNEQLKGRIADTIYKDHEDHDTFAIEISTHYGFDYDQEFLEEVDENGLLELVDGSKVPFEKAKRDGFDALQIFVTNSNGKTCELVSEELS